MISNEPGTDSANTVGLEQTLSQNEQVQSTVVNVDRNSPK